MSNLKQVWEELKKFASEHKVIVWLHVEPGEAAARRREAEAQSPSRGGVWAPE